MSTLDLGTLRIKYKVDREGLKRDLADGETEVKHSGDRMGRSATATAMTWVTQTVRNWTDGGRKSGDGFWRAADGRLRDARGRFVAEGEQLGRAASSGVAAAFRALGNGFSNTAEGASSMVSALASAPPVVLGLAAAMFAAAPAAYALGGALGAIPAIAVGGIGAVATLGLGFWGLADAFKKTSGAGGAVVDRAHQVALAERRLTDANLEALAAQKALNRAREEAAERLEDLSRSLVDAQDDQADAIAGVAQARRDLLRAREGGNPDQIEAATRAYNRAQHQLNDVNDRLEDLQKEQADAAAAGVEGSDQVQAALDRQRKATEGVSDVTYDLKKAQTTQASAGGQAATKLAASAMAVVAVIKGLKHDFEILRLDVQQRLFAGADVEIRKLWDAWLPTLRLRLGSMATMFNGLFKTWATNSRDPEFIANISAGWAAVEDLIKKVGQAVAGPGLDAFGRLSRAAAPFLDKVGDKLAAVVKDFDKWIKKADESGSLKDFFTKAGKFFDDIVDIGGDVLSIIGSVIGILTDAQDRHPGESSWDYFKKVLDWLAKWMADPKNQKGLSDTVDTLADLIALMIKLYGIGKTAWDWGSKFGGIIQAAITFKSTVAGMWDAMVTGAKAAFTAVALFWNNTVGKIGFTLPKVLGGGSFQMPNITIPSSGGNSRVAPATGGRQIPALAGGGLVRSTPGGRRVDVAEAGDDEIVSPVEMMRRIVAEEMGRVEAERGPREMVAVVPIEIGGEVVRVVRVELREHDREANRGRLSGAGAR